MTLVVNRRPNAVASIPRVNAAVKATLRVSTQTKNESEMPSLVAQPQELRGALTC